jgi:hypothetical protein
VVTFEIVKSNYAARGEPVRLIRDKRHGGALRTMHAGETEAYESALRAKGSKKNTVPPSAVPSGRPAFDDC